MNTQISFFGHFQAQLDVAAADNINGCHRLGLTDSWLWWLSRSRGSDEVSAQSSNKNFRFKNMQLLNLWMVHAVIVDFLRVMNATRHQTGDAVLHAQLQSLFTAARP
eukprot:3016179-Rhodomonas_salina.1